MADAEDLKSSDPKGRAGSSPALGTIESTFYKWSRNTGLFRPAAFCSSLSILVTMQPAISMVRRLASPVACVYRSMVLTDL